VKRMANPLAARPPGQENHQMQAEDAELEQFRRGVNCAALLEGWSPSWRLDRRESTRRALKYRREEGEVLIVNHDGRGWWDPQSTAKGDIFEHRHVGKNSVVLKHQTHIALAGRNTDDRTAVDSDIARGWLLQADDHIERCRFAATGGPEQGDGFAGLEVPFGQHPGAAPRWPHQHQAYRPVGTTPPDEPACGDLAPILYLWLRARPFRFGSRPRH